jgi:hypothetical protein
MRSTPAHDNVFDFNCLLHPGTVFTHPRDVVDHPALSLAEKRAILASWASDASAIASCSLQIKVYDAEAKRTERIEIELAPA